VGTNACNPLLKISEEYGIEFSVIFNATKSVCMQVCNGSQSFDVDMQFCLDGRRLSFVYKCSHIGRIISA